ncbi:MAG: hypothetical protein R3C56_32585 [Pirellulaceae bacterium]
MRLRVAGATAEAKEQSDFLTSDDPWFRPNDIQLGCDGAMYVSDFYNRIIGHYGEVPLEHPGRDRSSGRIWKISYDGPGVTQPRQRAAIDQREYHQRASQHEQGNVAVWRSTSGSGQHAT